MGESKASIALRKIEYSKEITFLDVWCFSDNTVVKVNATTYGSDLDEVQDSLEIVFKDTKRRQAKTLEKLGVDKEALLNGVECQDGFKTISEYFISHDGLVVGIDAKNKIKKINKKISELEFKQLDVASLNLDKEAEYCNISQPKDSLDSMCGCLKRCIKKYESIQNMEYNKYDCVVNYAYYQELEFKKSQNRICCVTSIGKIFYDIDKDEWSMTKKEQTATGLRIENFNIESIKKQLKEKYRVTSIVELCEKLKKKS